MNNDKEAEYANFYSVLCEVLEIGRKLNGGIGELLEHPEFQRRGRQICCSIARNEEDAKDLFQEACLRVWKYGYAINPENIHHADEFFSWFYVLSRHAFVSMLRKQGKRPKQIEEPPRAAVGADLEDERLRGEFEEFIKTLPRERQRVIEYWLQDFSYREIEGIMKGEGVERSYITFRNWVRDAVRDFFSSKDAPAKKVVGF